MEVTCDYCRLKYNYTGGKAHYSRTKYHYCSRVCQAYGNNVIKGNIISGKASKKNSKDYKQYQILEGAKKRSKLKNIEFNIDIFDIPEIPKTCPVLGIKIIANTTNSPLDSSPSIDRIDPNKGYIKGNIRIISNRANRIKSDATIDELELILKDLKRLHNEKL